MKKLLIFSFALCALSFALFSVCFAEETTQKFPFIGKVNADNVNIRAGANQNFEILAKANSGDLLYVAEEAYGWYKVRLPKSAHCYIARDFVEKKDNNWVSKTGSLNLRARPNKESSVIGQIKKGDKIFVASEDADGWLEILPPQGVYGWIKKDLVEFGSSDVQKWELAPAKPAPVAQGEVQNMGFTFRKRPGSHRLVSGGKTIYYLKSDKCNLKNFEGHVVSVWGDMLDLKTDKLVIDVTEVEACK